MEVLHYLLSIFRWESERGRRAASPPPGASEDDAREWRQFRRLQTDLERAAMLFFLASIALFILVMVLAINGNLTRQLDKPVTGAWMGLTAVTIALAAKARGRSVFWGLFGLGCMLGLVAVMEMGRRCTRCGTIHAAHEIACSSCGAPI